MTKYSVEILPVAYKDLDSIFDFILLENPTNSKKILDKIMTSLQILEDYPFSNQIIYHKSLLYYNFRALIVAPYIVFYRVLDNKVFVYRILHEATNYINILLKI